MNSVELRAYQSGILYNEVIKKIEIIKKIRMSKLNNKTGRKAIGIPIQAPLDGSGLSKVKKTKWIQIRVINSSNDYRYMIRIRLINVPPLYSTQQRRDVKDMKRRVVRNCEEEAQQHLRLTNKIRLIKILIDPVPSKLKVAH